jgi:CMP-N-acetylneuraminic acid synthetase
LESCYKQLTRAIDCDMCGLESVLDRYAPDDIRKGNWRHNPVAPDPIEAYKACQDTLSELYPGTRLSTAQHIRRALANKEDGSTEILTITRTLAKYLQQYESGEKDVYSPAKPETSPK